MVFVLRRGRRTAFRVRAENIGYVNDLYSMSSPFMFWGGPGVEMSIDPSINGYESSLPQALDKLDRGEPLRIGNWLRVLVPYVASIFVRGHDFIPRFRVRPSVAAGDLNTADNANVGRVMELERLLAPVCCARWVVTHRLGGDPFVLNDLGLTGTVDASTGDVGWALPISMSSVLGIFPKHARDLALYDAGEWWAAVEHGGRDALGVRPFNESMARRAVSYVIGPTQQIVERLAPLVGEYAGDAANMMESWPFDHKTRLAHAHEWHRLITATDGNPAPDELGDLQAADGSTLAAGWHPPVGIILNMREFPTGLRRIGRVIRLTMEPPQDYQDHFIRTG